MLSLVPESGISPTKSCKPRVDKKRVPQGEKMGFVTRRQDTKQSKVSDVLASFLCLKSSNELLITIRMSMNHKALHDLWSFSLIKPHLPVTVCWALRSHNTAYRNLAAHTFPF